MKDVVLITWPKSNSEQTWGKCKPAHPAWLSFQVSSGNFLEKFSVAKQDNHYKFCELRAYLCYLFSAVKKTNETIVKHKDQERIEFEEKLRLLNESFEKRVEHLTKVWTLSSVYSGTPY